MPKQTLKEAFDQMYDKIARISEIQMQGMRKEKVKNMIYKLLEKK